MKLLFLLFVPVGSLGGCSDYDLHTTTKADEGGGEFVDTAVIVPLDEEDEPVEELLEYEVGLRISADDQWEGWLDGIRIDQQEGWNQVSDYSYVLSSGTHVLAVRVDDLHLIINGLIAEVSIDGEIGSLTGDGSWRVRASQPPAEWIRADYTDGDWAIPLICEDDAPWSGIPTLVNAEAEWIWHDGDCRQVLGSGWFRLALELP